jgi:hypothetical protein
MRLMSFFKKGASMSLQKNKGETNDKFKKISYANNFPNIFISQANQD